MLSRQPGAARCSAGWCCTMLSRQPGAARCSAGWCCTMHSRVVLHDAQQGGATRCSAGCLGAAGIQRIRPRGGCGLCAQGEVSGTCPNVRNKENACEHCAQGCQLRRNAKSKPGRAPTEAPALCSRLPS
eukprot:1149857-Pelagomonas_calceolata.AAC.2